MILHPTLTALNLVLSVGIVLLSPAWAPAVAVLCLLFHMLVYDLDLNHKGVLAHTLRLLLDAVYAASLAAFAVASPFITGVTSAFAAAHYSLLRAYDTFIFRAFVRPLARVPVESGFLARRIKGPTLASNHLWCIDSSTALL